MTGDTSLEGVVVTQSPVPKNPNSGQTPNLTKTVIAEQTVKLVVAKESFRAITSSTRTGKPYPVLH